MADLNILSRDCCFWLHCGCICCGQKFASVVYSLDLLEESRSHI